MKQRKFAENDVEKITEFKERSIQVSFPGRNLNVEKYKKSLLRSFKKEPDGICVLEENREIIGFIWVSTKETDLGRYGLIHQIYVKEEFRGNGFAKKLMDYAEEYFKEKGITRIKLTVTLENVPAVKLYEKIGYQKKRIIMEKDI